MKRILLGLLGAAALACANGNGDPNDGVVSGGAMAQDPNSAAAGTVNTFNHPNVLGPGGENGLAAGAAGLTTVGSPVAAAKYHGCTKISYAALGAILASRGAKLTGDTDALTMYRNSGPALGTANYAGRAPEALLASTSAMVKQADIFVAAAAEIQANAGAGTACPGVVIADAAGKFTKDGISCLIGKLATDAHVAVANQAVQDAVSSGATQDEGIRIAIAAILEAAHTCE